MHGKVKYRLLLVVAAALLLAACEPVKISQIKADPSRFGTKTIAVEGTVVNSVGVLGKGGYEIQDDTGRIFVISNHGIPSGGTKVTVEGTVFSGATVLGQPLGVAIRETKHHIH
jgi:hypothetical protein